MIHSVPKQPTQTPDSSQVEFAAVGDVTLGDHPLCVGFGAYSRFRHRSPIYPFQHALAELQSADVLFGNLECPLSDPASSDGSWASMQMRGHPRHVDGLTEAGFRVLNLANNHSMHHGREPFRDTVRLLEGRGIAPCGLSASDHRASTLQIVHAKGIAIGFLGYSLRPRQHFDYEPLYTEGNVAGIVRDVREAKMRADVVVVSLHWGEEFVDRPSAADVRLARAGVDAGADLIVGHHPHVVRGIEVYRHGIIVYSLGNFVGDMAWEPRLRETFIFKCRITRSGVSTPAVTPVWINDNYQPEILTGSRAAALERRIQDLSAVLADPTVASVETNRGGYEQLADAALRQHRRQSHRHFLFNLHRYPPRVVAQQIGAYVRRNMAARHAHA
jgi:poly-gamma-glutamate synthesis protein (capsule biosynthesis protein)